MFDISEKKCSKCKIIKFVSDFGKRSRNKTGLTYACKECLRAAGRKYAKKRRLDPKQRKILNERTKEWKIKKLEENPDFYKEEYNKNHEKNIQKSRKFYHNNREKCLRQQAEWRKNYKDVCIRVRGVH